MRATWLAIGLTALIASSAFGQFSEQQAPYGRGYQPRARATFGYPASHAQVNYAAEEDEAPADEIDDESADSGAAPDYERVEPSAAGDSGYSDAGYGEGGYPGEYGGDDGCCADGCCPIDGCDAAWSGPGCGKGARCAPPCAPCEPSCGMSVWVNVDFMALWLKGDKLPPIVTSSDPGTPASTSGILGQPSTHVLFGNGRVNREFRPGGRVQMGLWLNGEQSLGIDGHYYSVATASQNFYSQSNYATTDPNAHILAIPTVNGVTGAQAATLIAHANAAGTTRSGSVSAIATSDLQSAAGGARLQLWSDGCGCNRIYGTGGYRFFRLDEGLTLGTQQLIQNQLGTTSQATYDRFRTLNQFQGTYIADRSGLG